MDNRIFGFLLITFAVCISLTDSFPRVLSNMYDNVELTMDDNWPPFRRHDMYFEYGSGVPDDLSRPEDSSEEQSGSYSDETQQQQVLQTKDQFLVSSDSSEQEGAIEQNRDNQFTFASSEQFAVEPTNSTNQQDILFTGDHHTATFEKGKSFLQKVASDKIEESTDSAPTTAKIITNSSQSSPRNNTIVSQTSPIEKTTITFIGNNGSSTDKSGNKTNLTKLNPVTSQPTTIISNETNRSPSFSETSDEKIPEKVSSTDQNETKILVIVNTSPNLMTENPTHLTTELPDNLTTEHPNNLTTESPTKLTTIHPIEGDEDGHSTLKPQFNSTSNISDSSDRCDSTDFKKPTSESESSDANKSETSFNESSAELDEINDSVHHVVSSVSEKHGPITVINNNLPSETKTGESGGEQIFDLASDNKKTVFSSAAGSKSSQTDLFPAGTSVEMSSDSTLTPTSVSTVASTSTSLTDKISSSLSTSTAAESTYESTVSDSSANTEATVYSASIEVTESVDAGLPDTSVKSEHVSDNQFFIAPSFISKHILKDADMILHKSRTSNTSHGHENHTHAGIPHNALDEDHSSREQHDSPHTNVSIENPHHTVEGDEPQLPHSHHVDTSLNTKPTGNPDHLIGGDEPQLPHSHHMNTSNHTKPTGSPHHIIGGDEPQLPHCHHMNNSHHTNPTGSPHHIIGGDEPQLPHSHHMKTLNHSYTETLHHVTGSVEPKLPHSHHMNTTSHTNGSAELSENIHHVISGIEPKLPHTSHEDTSSHVIKESNTNEAFNNNTLPESSVILEESVNKGNDSEESIPRHQLTDSTGEDSLRQVHTDRAIDSSHISPVLFRNSKHASSIEFSETEIIDQNAQSTLQIPQMVKNVENMSVADDTDQVSSDDEQVLVSDEQYLSDINQFPVRNHNHQDSEQPKDLDTGIQFLKKPTMFQDHETNKSKNPIKGTEFSDNSSVQNQGSATFISGVVSHTDTNGTAQHQDTTFISGGTVPKKQANGDKQYFIEQMIYPKQFANNVRDSSVAQNLSESSDIKIKHVSEVESKLVLFTNFASENPSNTELRQDHRFTIPEILSTVSDNNNDTLEDRSKSMDLDEHKHVDKIFDPSSTINNVSVSGSVLHNKNETTIPEFLASSGSNTNIHHYKQVGNPLKDNKYYRTTTPTPTTLIKTPTPLTSTVSSTSPGTESTSEETTSSEASTVSSTTAGSTSPPQTTTTSMTMTSTDSTSTSPDTESTSTVSSQATSLSTSTSTSSSSTTTTSPNTEITLTDASSEATTSSDTTNTDIETPSPSKSSEATSTITPSTISSSSSPDTTEMVTTSTSTSSQTTPSSTSTSSTGTVTTEVETTSTTAIPSPSISSSTSSGTTTTTPKYLTTPPYKRLEIVDSNTGTADATTQPDFSQIKFDFPPKPHIGIKQGRSGIKGGDRKRMFYYYSKPWYYVSEGRPLQNPF